MPRLHFSQTNYNTTPPVDINPLLLQLYEGKKLLVVAARDAQIIRHKKRYKDNAPPIDLTFLGWWEFKDHNLIDDFGKLNVTKIKQYDGVVILDRMRIDSMFYTLVEAFIQACQQ